MSMYKHDHWKVSYGLRVHQFTTQQVGEEGKRRKWIFNRHKNVMLSMQNILFKGNYLLKVHQFTTQYPILSMHNHVHSKVTYKSAQVDSMWKSCDHDYHLSHKSQSWVHQCKDTRWMHDIVGRAWVSAHAECGPGACTGLSSECDWTSGHRISHKKVQMPWCTTQELWVRPS